MSDEIVKKKSLASYVFDLEDICSEIDEETGEISDDLIARFDDAKLALGQKVDRWIAYLDALKLVTAEAKERQERAHKAKKSFEALNERLRGYLKFVMETNPNVPFKGTEGSLRLQRNPEAVELDFGTSEKTFHNVIDAELLFMEPELNAYCKSISAVVIDKEKLKADLKSGVVVPWARLQRGSHVRVR